MTGGPGALTFAGGLILGLASSLHCAGMCGGIASSLMFAFDRRASAANRLRTLLVAQTGRVAAYVAAGAVVGSVGFILHGQAGQANLPIVLRVVAAVSLGWIGLGVLGLAPPLTFVDRVMTPFTDRLRPFSGAHADGARYVAPFVTGIGWGLMPCGMVYGALFYATLSGSSLTGALVMTGFGLGTLPAVTATALGIGSLKDLSRSPRLRRATGLSLLFIAMASVALPAARAALLCIH